MKESNWGKEESLRTGRFMKPPQYNTSKITCGVRVTDINYLLEELVVTDTCSFFSLLSLREICCRNPSMTMIRRNLTCRPFLVSSEGHLTYKDSRDDDDVSDHNCASAPQNPPWQLLKCILSSEVAFFLGVIPHSSRVQDKGVIDDLTTIL